MGGGRRGGRHTARAAGAGILAALAAALAWEWRPASVAGPVGAAVPAVAAARSSGRLGLFGDALEGPLVRGGTRPRRWQVANFAAMLLNVAAVSQPGRLDGEVARDLQAGRAASRTAGGRSFFMPAGWAFAIWGLIYAGEVAWCFALQFLTGAGGGGRAGGDDPFLVAASPWWAAACVCQSLWCATFRPAFRDKGLMWVSALCLLGAAACLSQADAQLRLCELPDTWLRRAALLPVELHFGWVCAAALVNLNQVAACMDLFTTPRLVALACCSELAAAGLGCTLALQRGAPALALVPAWALAAVCDQTRSRIAKPQGLPVAGAKNVLALGGACAAACLAAGVYVAAA